MLNTYKTTDSYVKTSGTMIKRDSLDFSTFTWMMVGVLVMIFLGDIHPLVHSAPPSSSSLHQGD